MPDEDLRTMLTKHFQWLDVQNDEFISWTSSLLYALQYAVRKTRNPKNPRTVSQECDIKICLWERDAAGNPIYPASNLIEFYRLPSEGVLRPEYHITEYLSHGKIDVKGCSSTVSLEELRRAGLFDLMPELDDENTKHDLFTRVLTLRSTILTTPIAISDFESKTARGIASLFARQYTMQAMLALLSLRLRDCEDAEFINMIQHDASKIAPRRQTVMNSH